jgi:hypothetical protein
LDLLGLITSGGVTGLFGAALDKTFGYFTKKQEIKAQESRQKHEIEMRKADAEILAQEYAARTNIAVVEAEAKKEVSADAAFTASFNEPSMYSERNQNWSMTLLDFLRGFVRPGLTLYLAAIVTVMYFQAHAVLKAEPIDVNATTAFLNKITDAVIYLASTACLWWFGTRSKK